MRYRRAVPASSLNPPAFSGSTLDRATSLRADAAWVTERLTDPTSRVVAASREGVLVTDGPEPKLVRRPLDVQPSAPPDPGGTILLGLEDGAALFAVDLEALEPSSRSHLLDGAAVVGMRDAGTTLQRSEGGLAAYLMALLHWHRTHRFCANCGAATTVAEAGYSRPCPRCGTVHFPRTDPVVIMLVENDGRTLLGRQRRWPPGQYSVLAGFVLPGESLEEAVVREVREESGIEVDDTTFVTSQPWPFPSSLMLGFEARSDGGEPAAVDGELEDVRWFDLETVRAALDGGGGELLLPPSISISRFLIERWAAE